jgi:hypothetical protein
LNIRNLLVAYGAWLEKAFNVSIDAIGMATDTIAIAELVGEVLVATISDRFGLKTM